MKARNKHLALGVTFVLTGALLAALGHFSTAHGAQPAKSEISLPGVVPVEFRGCESAQTCRFRLESLTPSAESLLVVRPNGILVGKDTSAIATSVRDRLNSLLSNMIHQHKRIELLDLRKLGDDSYAATIIVNGMDVSADPILIDLLRPCKK